MPEIVTRCSYNIMSLKQMATTRWIWVACALLAAAGCGREERTPEAASTPPAAPVRAADPVDAPAAARPRIVFLGDSLTAGLGLPREQSVPSLIEAKLTETGYDYDVVNAGVSGDTSAGGLNRLEWSLDGDVRVLVVELGANDGIRGLPVDAMKRNLDQIIRTAKARGIAVVLTGMEVFPSYGEGYTSEFRRVFSDLAREHGVAFMPFFLEGVAGVPELNQGDGIHPNAEGARIVADNLWQTLEPILADIE